MYDLLLVLYSFVFPCYSDMIFLNNSVVVVFVLAFHFHNVISVLMKCQSNWTLYKLSPDVFEIRKTLKLQDYLTIHYLFISSELFLKIVEERSTKKLLQRRRQKRRPWPHSELVKLKQLPVISKLRGRSRPQRRQLLARWMGPKPLWKTSWAEPKGSARTSPGRSSARSLQKRRLLEPPRRRDRRHRSPLCEARRRQRSLHHREPSWSQWHRRWNRNRSSRTPSLK